MKTEPNEDPVPPQSAETSFLYRLDDELWVDGEPIGVATGGPARWRPGHIDQIAYVTHSQPSRAGVFLFERVHLRNLSSGTTEVVLDIEDHGWSEAGHIDWDPTGTRLVFAAQEPTGLWVPHILEIRTGELRRIDSEVAVIDTVFAPDGRIAAIDITDAAAQFEPVVWLDMEGRVDVVATSVGVNRDPVVSPDGRFVANIRASGPLARIFIGRWDLVITDLQTETEWLIGDGRDGFGPPRWIDNSSVVAKHGRYSEEGVIASIPDTVIINVETRAVTLASDIPARAWDPDPTPPTSGR
ncbi:MAG: hypothetical protein ACN4GZ_07970 [Acidimicrobiales bacterium]